MLTLIKNKIAAKLILVILASIFAMFSLLVVTNYYMTKKYLYDRVEIQAKNILEGLNFSLEGLLERNNMYAAQRMVSNLSANKEILNISIVNRNNIVIADTNPNDVNSRYQTGLTNEILSSEKPIVRYYFLNSKKILLLAQPLLGREYNMALHTNVIGVIFLEIDLSFVDKNIWYNFLVNLCILFVASLFVFVCILYAMKRIILNPIQSIQESTELIEKGNLEIKIPKLSNDEFGRLSDHLNRSNNYLITARENLQIAKQSGMAEIATSVLHNVGNVLNSVTVSIGVIKNDIDVSRLNNLSNLAELIEKNKNDLINYISTDENGKLIFSYITALSNSWLTERAKLLQEIKSLENNVSHITQIISMQQIHAGVYNLIEPINISEILESAVKISSIDILNTQHSIKVIREYDNLPLIETDKTKLLQILINIIKNAKDSLSLSTHSHKIMTLRLKKLEKTIQIEIIDNGIGISAENISKIFTHGYTTKKTGHGFGLPSCIFIAKELHGTLNVSSLGHNKGAIFTLKLPINIQK